MRLTVLTPLALAALTLAPALDAAEPASAYTARLAAPLAGSADLKVMGSVPFRCEGDLCTATRSGTARSLDVCINLARRVGRVTTFERRGRALSDKMVESCNTRARV